MNRYFKEVMDAHELIRNWLGNSAADDKVCENLLARFSPAYSMMTTGGALLNINQLNSFFRTQRGARPGLNIEITDLQIVAESEGGAIVTYKERQKICEQAATLRFSTVIFELNQDGSVIWRHLHETSMHLD
ncbi:MULTISPECIES: DUF4440 domain-containing protein [unclassified Enterobacter]|jgi:hypothetical protein|uniref:DUF4440 domain-containing protein n=1 Tax=unclassified Enterobacter TaxID=2608935 RepID=UPI0015CBBC44|nr:MULTISPECIES: DUF4440 domain-containing protein [unclassified Enterobacter]MBB3307875.1 hypothetical protein [Enterobacter sp. Sphag1F]NYI16687.1 hypothetical protein [Enterobacter sp. Sphag71]